MTRIQRSLLAALLLVAAGASSAEIFRCRARDGSVTYQQDPCASASEGGAVNIPATYPDYGFERERLAQREAALDARLIRRLEIEAAERIARDDRISREKEAQAARDLAQAQSQGVPLFFAGRPLFASRHPRRSVPAGMR
jgi:hypothetical protein